MRSSSGIVITVLLLVVCLAFLFTKCSVPSIESQVNSTDSIQFIKVDDLGYNEVWMDRDTHVLYIERTYAMFPLLDADGTARTYEEVDWGK